jgi:hypothetical protein
MGSIYPSATKVIVWLGIADPEHTERAFRAVEAIGDRLDPPVELFTPAVCASLVELFDRPWFTRIWCVQEIRLACDALVLCGDYEVSWEKFGLAASWLFDATAATGADARLATLLGSVHTGPADLMFRNETKNLLWTLQSGCEFMSTDPKDKVYGLLSLVSPRAEADTIIVDYTKSVGAVYADTVVADIQLHSKLGAFAFISHPPDYNGTDEYRSWAPRWDNAEPALVLGYPEENSLWNASGYALVSPVDNRQAISELLYLQGVVYDTVLEVHEVMDFNLEDEDYDYSIDQEQGLEMEYAPDGNTEDIQIDADVITTAPHIHAKINMDIETGAQDSVTHPFLELFNKIRSGPYVKDYKELLARTMTAGTYYNRDLEDLSAFIRERYLPAFELVMGRLAHLDRHGTDDNFRHDEYSKNFEQDAVDNIMHGEVIEDLRAGKVHEQTFCLI